jgi:hypothetical protein
MKKLSFATLAITGALVSAVPALADTVNYSLTTVDPTVAPGATATFNSSIVAPSSNAGDISILSDFFSSQTGITIDDTDFNDTPFTLAPGQAYTGPLFSVTALGTDTAGNYDGFFDVSFEDASGSVFTDSAPFVVTVGSPSSVTTEPGSWLLLSTGLAGVGLLRRRFFTRFAALPNCQR